jgi:hypothetical protein
VQPNGQIQLSFIPPAGSSTNFNEFEIWRDNGVGFTKLDSVSSFAANTYLDITANGNNQSYITTIYPGPVPPVQTYNSTLPPIFETAPEIMLTLIDADGCKLFKILECTYGCAFEITIVME